MDGQDMPLTPKEIRELFITVRQNQTTMSTLSEQVKDIHRIIAGNGDYKSSLVGRLQIAEERQMVGAKKQDEMCEDLTEIKKQLNKHTTLFERDHNRIKDNTDNIAALRSEQSDDRKKFAVLKDTIEAARNKAVGIGIGTGIGTGAGLVGLSKLIEAITSSIP